MQNNSTNTISGISISINNRSVRIVAISNQHNNQKTARAFQGSVKAVVSNVIGKDRYLEN